MAPVLNMKYLEDYVDAIEELPLELQRNFTLIRELDATSEELMAAMEKQVVSFTSKVREMSPESRNEWLRKLLASFDDTVKHGEEKLALATQTYDVVDSHIRRLDSDLQRFEDEQLISPRVPGVAGLAGHLGASAGTTAKKRPRKPEVPAPTTGQSSSKRSATSQDTAARKKGRTTGTQSARAGSSSTTQKQKTSNGSRGNGTSGTQKGSSNADRAQKLSEGSDMPIDPNEPTYCFCQQVSFGEMVACDNPDCDIEWFHYECVGLRQMPKGEWFCPNCRKGRK